MLIRFTQNHTVKQGDGKGPRYKQGEVVKFEGAVAETYGRKYVNRGLAEEVTREQLRREETEQRRAAQAEQDRAQAAAGAEEAARRQQQQA